MAPVRTPRPRATAISRTRATTVSSNGATAAKSFAGRAARQHISHAAVARAKASTSSGESAVAWRQAADASAPGWPPARRRGWRPRLRPASRCSTSAGEVMISCATPSSVANCSARASAPPAGIIVAEIPAQHAGRSHDVRLPAKPRLEIAVCVHGAGANARPQPLSAGGSLSSARRSRSRSSLRA